MLGGRHGLFEERGDGGKAARRRIGRAARGAGEQVHCALGALGELLAQRVLVGAGHRDGRKAARGLATHRAVLQRGTQAHPVGHAVLVVGRNAQVAERLARRLPHARQEHRLALQLHRHHIVVVFARLAGTVTELVLHRRADVAQRLVLVRAGRRAQMLLERLVQRLARHATGIGLARGIGDVLDVHQSEIAEFDGQIILVRPGTGAGQLGIAANRAGQREGAVRGARHWIAHELELGAAILEARLVDCHAIDDQRLIDLDRRLGLLARGAVRHHHVRGEQLRHARGVVIHREFLERDRERQVLDQRAVGNVQDGCGHRGALGHEGIAPEPGIARRQPVLGRNLADDGVAVDRALAAEPHLGANQHVAIEQAANADHHDGRVRQDVAELVRRPGLGRQERGALVRHRLHAVATVAQQCGQPVHRLVTAARGLVLGTMVERAQAAFAHMILPRAHVGNHPRAVAGDAQGRGYHEESQDQQEPPGTVDLLERQRVEQVRPERPELVDVVRIRLVLLEHRADDAGDGDHR
ncbi:hypothetical protein D3C72_781550 [compost metagenome]